VNRRTRYAAHRKHLSTSYQISTMEAFASCNAKSYNPLAASFLFVGGFWLPPIVKSRMTGLAEEVLQWQQLGNPLSIPLVIGSFLLQLIGPCVYVMVFENIEGEVDGLCHATREFVPTSESVSRHLSLEPVRPPRRMVRLEAGF